MAEKVYNKLVRDNIPEVIERAKKTPVTRVADELELKQHLSQKLIEELNEFNETPIEEEVADLLEVIDGLIEVYKLDYNEIKTIKANKKHERGGFSKGIILEKVID